MTKEYFRIRLRSLSFQNLALCHQLFLPTTSGISTQLHSSCMWWYLISGSQAAGLSLVINAGGKYKVTLSLILAEGLKTKIRNKLLPSQQIPSRFSNSSQSAQHLWTLVYARAHARAHTNTPKTTPSVFCLLFIFLFYPLFPYYYWLLSSFRKI